MNKKNPYASTILACYVADIVQAVVINLTPILFLVLREQFALSYSQFGTLVFVNFCTQVAVDLAFSKAVDRYGFRPFMVISHMLCVVGFVLFACTPWLFPANEFLGFLLGTILFAGSGGLFELLLSPIIDVLPSENSAKAMSLLHSMYAWGTVLCIVLTTLSIFAGIPWYIIVLLWALLPLLNMFAFFKVPLCKKVTEAEHSKSTNLLKNPFFYIAFLAIAFGGAAEVTVSQWTSTYLQNGLGISKIWADLAGMGGFALMMGIGRLLHGIYGDRFDLSKLLILGSIAGAVCYLTIALSPWPWLGVIGCISAGFFLSLLWPGTLSLASAHFPSAGAFMFALLAAAGDVGGSVGPWLIGRIADIRIATGASDNAALRISILCAVVLPLLSLVFQCALSKAKRQSRFFIFPQRTRLR